MAFLDDIGKAFSNAGQKTKDMADIAKFNSLLSEEEKKINNLYFQIGKTYVQLHPTDYDDALSAYFQAYQESLRQIEELKNRIRQLRNIIDCPGCGSEMSGDALFCSKCGYRMPPKPVTIPAGMIKCASCGAIVSQNMKFCTGCGAPIVASVQPAPAVPPVVPQPGPAVPPATPPVNPVTPVTPAQQTAPVQQSAPVAPAAVPQKDAAPSAFCENCGSKLDPDCAFCVNCGTPVAADAEPFDIASVLVDAEADSQSKCPNCGAAIDGDSMFCIECGSKVK